MTLFEADDRVGGHAHTHDVDRVRRRTVAVDSGFIVLNDRTYPLLQRLFAELGVADPADRDEHEHHLRRVRAELRRRPRAPTASSPSGDAAARPDVLAAAARRSAASRRRRCRCSRSRAGQRPDLRRVPRPARLRRALRHPLRPAGRVLRVVDGPPARRWPTPRRTSSRSCATTASWCSATPPPGTPWSAAPASYVGAVTERLDVVRASHPGHGGQPQARRGGDRHRPRRAPASTTASTRSSSRPTPTRRCALLTDAGEEETALLGAFGYSTNVDAACTATSRVLPPSARGRASWNYRLEGCDTVDRPQPGVLLDEPAPGPPRDATRWSSRSTRTRRDGPADVDRRR